MKNLSNYQKAKMQLKSMANLAKQANPTDNPAIRMQINDSADMISRDLDLNEYQRNLLSNYACKLHPKTN